MEIRQNCFGVFQLSQICPREHCPLGIFVPPIFAMYFGSELKRKKTCAINSSAEEEQKPETVLA